MKKLKSNFINMLLSLTIISMIAGMSLSFMNTLTEGPISKSRIEKKVKAIQYVLPEVTNNPYEEQMAESLAGLKDSFDIFPGKNDDKITGYAISTYSEKGYNGLVKLMVGFDKEGKIFKIAVLEQKETPGLGTKMTSEKFLSQYNGKNPETWKLKVKKDGGDTDAITGATISSRAFDDAVQNAYDIYLNKLKNQE